MEIAVTVVIVAVAALFVSRRWIRSTRQTLQKASSGACGGDCAGCTLANKPRNPDTTSGSGR